MFIDPGYKADLTPISITISYDKSLQCITGSAKERAMVDRGCPFLFILHDFLMDYPEIEKRYPPGTLWFTLNGRRPGLDDKLVDGDMICFTTHTE